MKSFQLLVLSMLMVALVKGEELTITRQHGLNGRKFVKNSNTLTNAFEETTPFLGRRGDSRRRGFMEVDPAAHQPAQDIRSRGRQDNFSGNDFRREHAQIPRYGRLSSGIPSHKSTGGLRRQDSFTNIHQEHIKGRPEHGRGRNAIQQGSKTPKFGQRKL